MKFTGHRNVSSLNAYKKQQQRKMSEALSAMYSGAGRAEEAKQPLADICTTLGGVFSGAHLDGCTLNFNTYTGDEYGLSSSAMHYHHHKGKRQAYLSMLFIGHKNLTDTKN